MSNELVFGLHAVQALLTRQPERFIELYLLKGRQDPELQQLIKQARRFGVSVQFMHRKALDSRTGGATHQGVVAKIKPGKQWQEQDLSALLDPVDMPFLLVLDNVTDPHNLGACLRSADAAGVNAVIVPKDKSASLNATVRKVACGAAEAVPLVTVTNLARTLRSLQDRGVWVVGAAGEAERTLYQSKLQGPLALVMGAEGTGLRRLTRETCDELIGIPMAGSVSSLNVSVATGVCLFEVVRQRLI